MPDNAFYYHAAYAVAATVYVAYGISLWWRGRAMARQEAEAGLPRGDEAGRGR